MSELSLKRTLEKGIPYYGMDEEVPKLELQTRTQAAKDASLAAHTALYQAYKEGDKRVLMLDGDKPGEKDMYLTFKDARGDACYFAWDGTNPATDIGLRAVNPGYSGEVNPTTIVHADSLALQDFADRGAPSEVIEAVDAVAQLNKFVTTQIALPYMRRIAKAFNIKDSHSYIETFLPHKKRARTLTRAILYHLNARPTQRPTGSDGKELLIKEHNDKSAFTIDVEQSSPGLQYQVNGGWKEADTRIACFRGAADDYLPVRTPPTLHRAVYLPELRQTPPPELAVRGIARIAIPSFISPSIDGARVIQAGSRETHPKRTTKRVY